MAAAAAAANDRAREFHVHFGQTVMKAVPPLRREQDLAPEELTQITEATIKELMATLPAGSEERRLLEEEYIKLGDEGQKGWTFEQKSAMGGLVGGAAISWICWAVSEAMQKAKMDCIAEVREQACKLLEQGQSQEATNLLVEKGYMIAPETRALDASDAAYIRENHATSTTQKEAHKVANWGDYVQVAGSSVQLLSAIGMLGYTIKVRSDIIRDCTVDGVDDTDRATWCCTLNEQRKLLNILKKDYTAFIDDDVANLGHGGSLDCDGISPVALKFQHFVQQTQAIVIETQNLALQVQKKSAELASHLLSVGGMAVGASLQSVLALCQALARPNPATWTNFGLLCTAAVVSSASFGLSLETKQYLRDFDKEVTVTLIAAKGFLARMSKGRDLAEEAMAQYKDMQSTMKSQLQLALEEEVQKTKTAEEASRAKDRELLEIEELRRSEEQKTKTVEEASRAKDREIEELRRLLAAHEARAAERGV